MTRRFALLLAPAGIVLSLPADNPAGHSRFYVTSVASALIERGLAAAAPSGAEATGFQLVPNPGIRFESDEARATSTPWIDSNGWRYQRGLKKANYAKLPAGTAPLAAAEAFTFNGDAILNPDPADIQELGKMLQFLKPLDQPYLPSLANIAVVDDQSPAMAEALNLLTRRNLMYTVVSAPNRAYELTVQPGTKDFPKEVVDNPADFAAHVRAKLGDDKRLVRLYGTETMIAHLTGDAQHARLYLLSYGRNRNPEGARVRVRGRYRLAHFAAYASPKDAKLTDFENPGDATEFWLPPFQYCAVIDLESAK